MTGFEKHDHADCVASGISAAEDHCRDAGLKLTPVRRKVLEILLNEHRALGAYDILEVLARDGFASQPPVAYRALDFLVKHGFAHRIERLNAFVACAHPGAAHTPAFLVCRVCDAVAEAPTTQSGSRLGKAAETAGFIIEREVVEAVGVCPNCETPT